jgi:hypothetical protein
MRLKTDGHLAHKLYSLDDASRVLGGLSVWTLRKHISSGRLRVVRLGRRVFIDAEELERVRREGLPSLQGGTSRNQIPATDLTSEVEKPPLTDGKASCTFPETCRQSRANSNK